MDFAIAPAAARGACSSGWEVLCLRRQRGTEVVARLATFGYRQHAEAFLADLVTMVGNNIAGSPGRGSTAPDGHRRR